MNSQKINAFVTLLIFIFLFFPVNKIQSQTRVTAITHSPAFNTALQGVNPDSSYQKKTGFSYLAEFAAGALIGGVTALPAAYLGAIIDRSSNPHGEFAGLGGFIIGFGAGYLFGTALGVHLVDKGYRPDSDLGNALLGSISGIAVAGIVLWQNKDIDGTAVGILTLASPIIGAILAVDFLEDGNSRERPVELHYSNFKINDELVHSINIRFRLN